MQSGIYFILLIEYKLLIHLRPRILERYRTVKDKVVRSRILIDIEVTDALELQVIKRLGVGQILLDVALRKHLQ